MVEHWEYAIGILVWLNMLTWLVVGVLRDKKSPQPVRAEGQVPRINS